MSSFPLLVSTCPKDGSAPAVPEVTEGAQNQRDRDVPPMVLKNRRHHHGWQRVAAECAERLRGVLKRGDIGDWAERMHVDRSFVSSFTALEPRSPELPDIMLAPANVAIAILRANIVSLLPKVAPADVLDTAEALVAKAATALVTTRAALRDGKIDAKEEAEFHALADALDEISLRFRAVRRSP